MDYNSYNFFEPFAKTPQKTNFLNLFLGSIITIVLGVLLAFTGLVYFEKQGLESEKENKQQQIDAMTASLAEVTSLTEQLQEIQSAQVGILALTGVQTAIHYGKPDLFRQISSLLPDQMYLTRMHIGMDGQMEIQGTALDSSIIGVYENNLRSATGKWAALFVSQYEKIEEDDDRPAHYDFSLSFAVNNEVTPILSEAPAETLPEETTEQPAV